MSLKLIQTNIRIYLNENLATNKYLNIFVLKNLYEPMSKFVYKYSNILIFEYIGHTLVQISPPVNLMYVEGKKERKPYILAFSAYTYIHKCFNV